MFLLPSKQRLDVAHFSEVRNPGGWVLMDEYQQELTYIAFLLSDFKVSEAWLAYFGYGGNQDIWVVDAYLNGLIPLPAEDCELLAIVLDERLTELHLPRLASYRG
jgi:hypothetical protein